jgi:ketosteroid isomerase-like protein
MTDSTRLRSRRGHRSRRAVRALALAGALLACAAVAGACDRADARALSRAERAAIADSIARQVIAACDLRAPDVVGRLMSLYPAAGSVVSASGGRVTTTRDSLEANIRTFWDNVGHNMRDPTWQWTSMRVDVLAPNAAVMTATYRIPHRTPAGAPHVVGGAWTAVFERRAGRWVIVHEHLSDSPSP